MNKKLDLLLVNSFAPRQRIASDAALENSLALIRTYLTERNFTVDIIDEQRITGVENGVPKYLLRLLRQICKLQLESHTREFNYLTLFLLNSSRPLHTLTQCLRQKYMEKLIDKIVDKIKEQNIPIVGIKVWYGASFKWSALLADKIKENCPETIVIAGGPQVKVYAEHVLNNQNFDLAIMGPGEEVLETLLRFKKSVQVKADFLELIKQEFGSTPLIRAREFSDTKELSPNLTIVPKYTQKDLDNKILFHTLVDGIGCTWNKCNFCSHTRQQRYIPRPLQEIKREFLGMTGQGVGFFRFSSSETPVQHGKAVAQMILENNLKLRYSMFVRPGRVSPATFDAYYLMIKSGLRAVFMGGETGDDQVNEKIMNKGVTRADIINTIQCIKEAALKAKLSCRVGLSMIYPCPTLPEVSLTDIYAANLQLVKDAQPDSVLVNPPGIFPGTVWFDNPSSFGFDFAETYVQDRMAYEYSIYQPAKFWPKLDYQLNGQDSLTLLAEAGRLSNTIEAMGIPVNISDELLMMLDAIGYHSNLELLKFKKNSLIDIMSGNAKYLKEVAAKINKQSRILAASNLYKE